MYTVDTYSLQYMVVMARFMIERWHSAVLRQAWSVGEAGPQLTTAMIRFKGYSSTWHQLATAPLVGMTWWSLATGLLILVCWFGKHLKSCTLLRRGGKHRNGCGSMWLAWMWGSGTDYLNDLAWTHSEMVVLMWCDCKPNIGKCLPLRFDGVHEWSSPNWQFSWDAHSFWTSPLLSFTCPFSISRSACMADQNEVSFLLWDQCGIIWVNRLHSGEHEQKRETVAGCSPQINLGISSFGTCPILFGVKRPALGYAASAAQETSFEEGKLMTSISNKWLVYSWLKVVKISNHHRWFEGCSWAIKISSLFDWSTTIKHYHRYSHGWSWWITNENRWFHSYWLVRWSVVVQYQTITGKNGGSINKIKVGGRYGR